MGEVYIGLLKVFFIEREKAKYKREREAKKLYKNI
jgi:hypothetical protein